MGTHLNGLIYAYLTQNIPYNIPDSSSERSMVSNII